ncbi:hypothetical protein [Kordia sp.]|uniref:hypothetical protein n=1 Tax=Kordia sp. TaxID=1965332 RepID=UPI0025BE3606|nr:hypothetical protein [Kordia sp.]MCH2196120.1 hypothetical protein [Kordia sp.]
MKQFLFIVAFFATSFVIAQQDTLSATFDYEVSYEIKDRTKGTDTIKVAFDKSGRYLWTNYSKIADGYSFMFLKPKNENLPNFLSSIIYDTQSTKFYISIYNKELSFFMKVDLLSMVPKSPQEINEPINLIADKSSETIPVLNKERTIYKIYPSSEPEEKNKLDVVFDVSYPVNNNIVFGGLFNTMFISDNELSVKMDLPQGIILYVAEKNKPLLKAISIKKISRTITINNTLEIKE